MGECLAGPREPLERLFFYGLCDRELLISQFSDVRSGKELCGMLSD